MRASMVDLEMNCSTEKFLWPIRRSNHYQTMEKTFQYKRDVTAHWSIDLQRLRLKLRWISGQSCTTHHPVQSNDAGQKPRRFED